MSCTSTVDRAAEKPAKGSFLLFEAFCDRDPIPWMSFANMFETDTSLVIEERWHA